MLVALSSQSLKPLLCSFTQTLLVVTARAFKQFLIDFLEASGVYLRYDTAIDIDRYHKSISLLGCAIWTDYGHGASGSFHKLR